MAPKSTAKRTEDTTDIKKEKLFHPHSRKASQLERASLRKTKLATASTKRSRKTINKVDRVQFFYHCLPANVPSLSLPELHVIVQKLWLTRHDSDIEIEQAARRKGRPKSTKETKLLEIKLQDQEEYRSGIELPDLTHPPTVELFRKWKNGDAAYLSLLRFIRISSEHPDVVTIARYGGQEVVPAEDDLMMVEPTIPSTPIPSV